MSTRGPRRALPAVLAVVLPLPFLITACGLFGGTYDPSGKPSGGTVDVEQATVTVAVTKGIDVAPLYLALAEKNGYFKEEGLKVEVTKVDTAEAATARVTSGKSDIASSTYGSLFLAENANKARSKAGIKLIADASSTAPDNTVVVATPTSRVKHITDMTKARVAIADSDGISDLLVDTALQTNGVDYRTVKWVPLAPQQTVQALKNGRVDAALVVEPAAQQVMKTAGAAAVFDVVQGQTDDFPIAGWATTGAYAKANPKTIGAFQRALQRGTDLARSDRSEVEEVLVDEAGVDQDTARMAVFPALQFDLNETRIQRVPDLMLDFGVIKRRLDVRSMIVPTPRPDDR
jgi:NitT/TauT family transport system substrate-binding protein